MYQPTGDRVLIEPIEESKTTAGGVILPDTAETVPVRGVVLAVGPGRRIKDGYSPIAVEVGDEVMFSRLGRTEIEDDLFLVAEDDLLGVYED